MLIGYVSDERYLALADVAIEFENGKTCVQTRSTATGAVYADLQPGTYTATLQCPGFGAKREEVTVRANQPWQFRFLSERLLGYAWPKWVKSGERSEFRTHAAQEYQISLWRYGLQKERVRPLGWYDEHGPRATVQTTPDGDYTQTGVKFNSRGYSSPHHKQFAIAPEKSGLYYFHAETVGGETFGFPWVVAPSTPQAPVAVLLANLTWNAYNNFGGRSNYINSDCLPQRPIVNARSELRRYTDSRHIEYASETYAPLSFDRPEPINHIPFDVEANDPIEGRAGCHIAPAEWRLLAWLERQGFPTDVYAESQLHFDELPLDKYRVLILTAHPEYWTKKMYFQVKDWVKAGGKLVYLGGNGLNCEVELPDRSTMIVQNGDTREHDAQGIPGRFAARVEPEAQLLGVMYTPAGIMTAAPYEVTDDSHWIYTDTGLRNGERFGFKTLHARVPGGASGHETDKISDHSPAGIVPLAQGLNPDEGGAHIVHHQLGDGEVFSAGSICYPSALLVDEHVSQITHNVLRRFLE